MKSLKRKLDELFKENLQLRQDKSEAQYEMDRREREMRNTDIALDKTGRQLESQRVELYQENQLTDQAQREKSWLFGELGVTNGVFHEDRANDCQEIQELRRICWEETDKARQLKIDEQLSLQQRENPSPVKSAFGSDSGLAR